MKSAQIVGITVLMLFAFAGALFAQEEIFFLGDELGVGARAMGMGGAYVGVADDYSAMYWNPAGLGQLRRSEMNIGFSHNSVSSDATFLGSAYTSENTFTRLNSIGLIFPVPTYQGSLVFGLGFNKVRDFDNTIEIEGFNPDYAAYGDMVIPTYSEQGYSTSIDDSLYQIESLLEDGSMNHFSLSGALEVQKNFFLGATVNFISGKDNYNLVFDENDILGIYDEPFDDMTGVIADLDKWSYNNNITSKFNATNFKIGALYRFGSALRLGATVITPTRYKIREEWSERFDETYDWGQEDPFEDSGEYEYRIEEPYSFEFGASFKLLNILLSAGAEFKDWSQAKFHDDPPIAGTTKGDVNANIARELQSVTKLRFGAELYVPVIRATLMLGYFNSPSPYRYTEVLPDKEFISAGAGLALGRQARVHVGLIHGTWEQESIDSLTGGIPTMEEKSFDKVIGTLSIRF